MRQKQLKLEAARLLLTGKPNDMFLLSNPVFLMVSYMQFYLGIWFGFYS